MNRHRGSRSLRTAPLARLARARRHQVQTRQGNAKGGLYARLGTTTSRLSGTAMGGFSGVDSPLRNVALLIILIMIAAGAYLDGAIRVDSCHPTSIRSVSRGCRPACSACCARPSRRLERTSRDYTARGSLLVVSPHVVGRCVVPSTSPASARSQRSSSVPRQCRLGSVPTDP